MAQFIFVIFVLGIFIWYPQILIITGLLLAGFWLYGKYEVVERDSESAGGSSSEEDFVDPMDKSEKELESKMKPGYQDDPKWQEKRDKVNEHTTTMRKISDLEIIIEDLEEEMTENPNPGATIDLAEARKLLKTLENQAGITQRRTERAKEKVEPPPKVQTPTRDMTDQEIDAALQELNDSE